MDIARDPARDPTHFLPRIPSTPRARVEVVGLAIGVPCFWLAVAAQIAGFGSLAGWLAFTFGVAAGCASLAGLLRGPGILE